MRKTKAPPKRGFALGVCLPLTSIYARPGLATAEHAAEGAALHAQDVALQCNRGIICAASVGIEYPAAPFLILAGIHVDQNLLAIQVGFGVDRISAEIGAALLDADLAFLFFGQPDPDRRVGIPDRRGRGGLRTLHGGRCGR
jgi:hypothetical protein